MQLPANYQWLLKEGAPRELLVAISLYGVHEFPGSANNPVIMQWAEDVHTTYPGDATAWCGLYRAKVAHDAGWDDHPNGNCLWALNWASWGVARIGPALLLDTLVKKRAGGGHVTLYVGEDDECYHCLGGNQMNEVSIERIPKGDFVAIRHAPWRIAQPSNVRRVFLSPVGVPTGQSEV